MKEIPMHENPGAQRALEAFLSSLAVEEKGSEGFRVSATLRADCTVFNGHFPGNPILPGAFHVWIACLLLARLYGLEGKLASVQKAKFRKLLLPRDFITIHGKLTPGSGETAAACRIEKDGREASKFRIVVKRA
ncbi:MAG: hypothetical protein ABIJ56_08385 [Pseudomonadota bacterium]